MNGRIYLQTSEGLRPAKITFPGDDEEKLENIARVSVKTTERYATTPPTSGRRKSSKNESSLEESSQKQCTTKHSPVKDSDERDKSSSKSRRGARSPPKTGDQRKLSKTVDASAAASTSTAIGFGEPTSPLKSKRETRAERREAKLEWKNTSSDVMQLEPCDHCDEIAHRPIKSSLDCSDSVVNVFYENMNTPAVESCSDTIMDSEELTNFKPWTRREDMILLQNIKKDYSESTFAAVSATLGDRTVEQVKIYKRSKYYNIIRSKYCKRILYEFIIFQVKQRCETLLTLLEKII